MNATDDWYDVRATADGGLRIVEGGHYGQFLVPGRDRALLVDAGVGVGDLRRLVADRVDVPVTLLLTHAHWDLIGNAAQFDDVRVHDAERAPGGGVAVDGPTDEFVHRPAEFAETWLAEGRSFPDDFDPETYEIPPVESARPVEGGDRIDLGDRTFEVLHTPGHSPGHLSLLDRDAGVLYGGDVVHLDAGLYAHFERSDLRALRETFARLVALWDDGAFDALHTSHNPTFAGPDLALLDRLRAGLDRILAGDADPALVETPWGPAHRYEFGGSPVLTTTSLRDD
jgi:glyoxylase-like metal-dependent hydrolase (beta-lactamase superfamily II)